MKSDILYSLHVKGLHLPVGASFGGLLVEVELMATERADVHELSVHDFYTSMQLTTLKVNPMSKLIAWLK